jgi:hypothetical protein
MESLFGVAVFAILMIVAFEVLREYLKKFK